MTRKEQIKTIVLSTTQINLLKSALRYSINQDVYMNTQKRIQAKILLQSLRYDLQNL